MELVSCQPPDDFLLPGVLSFNALMGLSCYRNWQSRSCDVIRVSMPSWAWVVTCWRCTQIFNHVVSMPSWAWVVTLAKHTKIVLPTCFNALMGLSCYVWYTFGTNGRKMFQCPHGLELLLAIVRFVAIVKSVSMPSWAWVVTTLSSILSLQFCVSMPSWAWVVTARMSNILNFSWYFLCIPAIYKCILAYLPIFFNQLSKFLRCESPSTFLGTCLSHHSFIIFLVTNINTLLSGLYLISTGAII